MVKSIRLTSWVYILVGLLIAPIAVIIALLFREIESGLRHSSLSQEALTIMSAAQTLVRNDLLQGNFVLTQAKLRSLISDRRDNFCLIVSTEENRDIIRIDDFGICENSHSKALNQKIYFDDRQQLVAYRLKLLYGSRAPQVALTWNIAALLLALGGFILIFAIVLAAGVRKVFQAIALTIERRSIGSGALSRVYEIEQVANLVRSLEEREEFIRNQEIEKSRSKALYDLSMRLAHDIRSPLASIKMILKIIKDGAEHKDVLISSVEKLNQIADGLLENVRQHHPDFAIGELIKEVSVERTFVWDRLPKKIAFEWQVKGEVRTKLQSIELKRILSNILNNAYEACPENAKIVLCAYFDPETSASIIDVSDEGNGIPIHIRSDLGNRAVSAGKERGNGLGLYHAFLTLRTAGGNLEILDRDPKGTTVRIILP